LLTFVDFDLASV